MYNDPRFPKSFPAAWASEWGDNSLGLFMGIALGTSILRLQFVEATYPDRLGFWISDSLGDQAQTTLVAIPDPAIAARLATPHDCGKATAYFNSISNFPVACQRVMPLSQNGFEHLKHLVIPDKLTP